VIEFAIKHLKFSPKSIILYGWSIGGFASTYLAKKFPEVHAVVNINYLNIKNMFYLFVYI